jgi:hypothetical protein
MSPNTSIRPETMLFDIVNRALHRAPLGDRARERALELVASTWKSSPDVVEDAQAFAQRVCAAGGPTIVFVVAHRGNFPTVEYVASSLREKGVNVFGVYLFSEPAPWHVFSDDEDRFTPRTFGCGGSLAALAEIAIHLPAIPIYLQAHARWAFLSMFIKSLSPDLRVVQEIYDWMGSFVGEGHEQAFADEGVFSLGEIDLMRDAERYVRNELDGFVYKDGGAPMAKMLANARSASAAIVPAPPHALWPQEFPRLKGTSLAGATRVVHAGQIRSRNASRRVFGDIMCLDVFRELTSQGIDVDAFPSFYKDEAHRQQLFGDYLEEQQQNPRFRLEQRLSMVELIHRMHGRYHYGSLLYHFDDDLAVGKAHLAGATASKLFTYLAAGLPILVSEELEHMASIVRENGFGLVLSRSEIPTIGARLRDAYPELLRNVERRRHDYTIERCLPALEQLLLPNLSQGTR